MQPKPLIAASSHHAASWHYMIRNTCVFLALFTTAFALIPTMGPAALAASRTPTPQPNHTTATAGAASVLHLPPAPSAKGFTPKTTPQPIGRQGTPSMTPGSVPLTPDKDTTFTGSDGKLTVKVPAGAVSAADVSTAGGSIALKITQIAPASGSAAGGSGLVSFGTYLFDIVDSKGQHLAHGLRKDAALTLQYGSRSSAVDLDHAYAIFNGSLPHGTQAVGPVGAYAKQKVTHDAQHHTLTVPWAADPVVSGVSGTKQDVKIAAGQSYPKTTVTWVTNAYVATYGKPDPLSVNLNAGSLTEGLQIDAPAGPGGTLPNITLAYSSAAVNQQHSPQGAAGWVGEGWNLSLGQISWTEHNALSNTNTPNWEDSWQMVDPFGTSATLIPPNINVATYYDDTPNNITPSPVQWHTSAETYDKIYSFVGPNGIGMPTNPPCFRVFQPSGIMEEFGCTPDSLQYYYVPGAGDYIANWNLDLITNPQGNQVHVTYQQDLVTTTYNSVNYTYPRDTVLSTIEWDSPSCTNAQTMCTGASWAPLNRVSFGATHTPSRLTNTPSNCNTGSNARCDDPLDLSGSGGLGAPEEQTTFALNDITVQTRSTGTGTWNNLHDYQLSYEQSGPTTRTDPASGLQDSMAGMFDLTAVKEIGSDGTTSQPATTYSYATQTEYYEDSTFYPYSTSFCGPTWNTGGNGGSCDLWSQSYDGNSRYISSVSNGLGMQQTFTWANARNNTHGSSSPADPLYCNSHQTGYPCNSADDQAWSRFIVTGQSNAVKRITQNGQGGTQTTTPVTSTYAYTYQLTYPLVAQECTDCVSGMYWGNQNDGDYLDYYNSTFMGFTQGSVSNPDGSVATHKYYATEGFGVYDNTQVTNCPSNLPPINTACHNAPWWHVGNAAHGQEYEADYYDTNGTTLLKKTTATYQAVCPPGGVSASPSYNDGTNTYTWDGNLVAELDHNNPVAVCDVQKTQDTSTTYDGTSNPVTGTNSYTYDTGTSGNYGRLLQKTTTTSVGASNPATIVAKQSYVWNDSVSASGTGATGTYIVNARALAATEDGSGNRTACAYISYDGLAYTTGQTSGLIHGNATTNDSYTNCGTAGNSYTPSGQQRNTQTFDTYGNQLASEDPDANGGVAGHTGCMVSGTPYTNCQAYDATTQAKPTVGTNALNQTNMTTYGSGSAPTGGFGWWASSATDANSQIISQTYDALGRVATKTLPNESGGNSTETLAYTNWCTGTSAQTPCLEVDSTQRLDSSTTVTSRSFYDGMNRLIETRTAAPGSQDVVSYNLYNAMGQITSSSVKYFVTAYTGASGASAYSTPDTSVAVRTVVYDGQGRVTNSTDALSHTTTTNYTVKCSPVSGDSNCYEQVKVIDANLHQTASFTDGLGRTIYLQQFTGTSPYTLSWTSIKKYDTSGHEVSTTYPDGTHASTATYDGAGNMTTSSDPDLGSYTYGYDQNGNLTSISDPRGATGTIYLGYDGLNRVTWKSTNSNGSSPFATYTYDNSVASANGIGRLATENFTSNGVSGSYAYTYDGRGEPTSWTMTLGGTNYAFQLGYNDAGQQTSVTYPDGDIVTTSYGAQDWLAGVTETLSGTTTTLLNTIQYQGAGGAGGQPTSAQIGNSQYTWTGSYDVLVRPTDTKMQSSGTTLFDQTRTYDAVGNVITANTTLSVSGSAKTDNQTFCYDEQNRLVWAGSTGTPSCGRSLTAGTLTSAQYQQSYSYDTLNRLTSGPLGSGYTYGSSSHLDAVTSTGSGYGAAYDTAGDMTCRAPTTSQTCSGTQTGQQMAYDAVRRLLSWQNAASSPTQTASYAYDGDGQRVQQSTTNAGTTTTTKYIGSYEDITTTGGTTTTTKYYDASLVHATNVNGTLSYLATDQLNSISMALSSSGSVQATQLFAPYGGSRYSSGTMPTSHGFTGQRGDPSGLDYFNARYYDPSVGQFTSADSVQGPNRYAYVNGNPETLTDPSGNCAILCTVLAGAAIGAVVGAATSYIPQVVSNVQQSGWSPSAFTNVNGGAVLKSAAAGAVGGAVAGLGVATLGTSLVASTVVGAASNVASQATDNALNNRPIGQNLGQAALTGAASGAAFWGVGKLLGAAGDAVAGGCPNSFDPATVVATPHGEQTIGSLQVGDAVQAYDPTTGKVQTEPVQHVFINHDTNLLDVTLTTVADRKTQQTTKQSTTKPRKTTVSNSGSQPPLTEVLHTTTEHPFLTQDRGFVNAAQLTPNEHIIQLDGSMGTVVNVKVVSGEAVRYNLTVKDLHTYAVGLLQAVVHNCGGDDQLSKDFESGVDTLRGQRPNLGQNLGGYILRDDSGNPLRTSTIFRGGGPAGLTGNHTENQILNDLRTNATKSSSGSYILDVFTEREPCSDFCSDWFTSGRYGQAVHDILGSGGTIRIHTRGSLFNPGADNWYRWKP